MNGAVERLIRSVKEVLPVVLQGQVVTQDTLITLVAIIEATLNNRPLTIPIDDLQDLTVLTPNCFMIQWECSFPQVSNVEDGETISRKKPRQSVTLANIFWHR